MNIDTGRTIPLQTTTMADILTYTFNHINNIDYSNYNHKHYLDNYKYLFISNNTNFKLYNLNNYLSYIHFLEINNHISKHN